MSLNALNSPTTFSGPSSILLRAPILVNMAFPEPVKVEQEKRKKQKQADQHYNHTNILVCFIQLYPIIRLP